MRRTSLAVLASLLVAGAVSARPAAAAQLDDRTRSTPVGWWYVQNRSEAQINAALAEHHARPVDLVVRNTNPWRFDMVMVANSGAYAMPSFGWFYDRTEAQVRSLVQSGGIRITDLEANVVSFVPRYAGVLVPNTGALARQWDWIPAASTGQLDARLRQGWRLVSLTRFGVGSSSFWAGVIHRNRGAELRAAWWYPSLSATQVGQKLDENHAQLIDLDRVSSGRWAVVMTASPAPVSGWFYDARSADELTDRASYHGLRLIDARPYATSGGPRWAGVGVENLDAASRRIAGVLGTKSRQRAFYLKQVGGPVRAALQRDLVHEALSSIKILIHLRTFQEIEAGTYSLTRTQVEIVKQEGPECWNYTGAREPLQNVLGKMMFASDNGASRALVELVGRESINEMAQELGLTHTSIATWNCVPRPMNPWTLREAAAIYEAIADGTALRADLRTALYDLMPGRGDFTDPINTVILTERPRNMSAADLNSFMEAWTMHYKAGSWVIGSDEYFDATRAINVAGILRLPRCSGRLRVDRQYVFGMLAESDPEGTAYDDYHRAQGELFREVIREALATWSSCAP